MRVAALLAGLCLALPLPRTAQAHPHEFVDIALGLRFDDLGRLAGVEVGWTWDDLTSMLMLEDFGLDPDGDGRLTEDERGQLIARFGDWPEDFDGDLYLTRQGRPVALGGPRALRADLRDGRLFVGFSRALPQPLDLGAEGLALQAYDPGYYVAYDLAGAPEMLGRDDCTLTIRKADVAAAQKLYGQLLGQLTEEEVLDQGRFPEVGGAFADEVRVTCAARP